MISNSLILLVVTGALLLILLAIGIRAMSRKRKKKIEAPKYRMLDDD